jgi:acetolactate synthase-1/2/3 large subunit
VRGANKQAYNPDFAGWAKAAGVDALTVTRSEDFKGALEHAIRSERPFLIDVHVDANVRPPATGTWALPPIPHKEPVFGQAYVPEPVDAGE